MTTEIENIPNEQAQAFPLVENGKGALPLVSIIVITYNSSKYVLETLESARAQTYQNIELIVSDDCSTDNTVDICRTWLDANKERFVRTELITVEKNTGIAPNCNRGLYAAQGEWVKYIAGDDILKPCCIEFFYKNTTISGNKDKFFFCDIEYFTISPDGNILKEEIKQPPKLMELEAKQQFRSFLKKACYVKAPGSFMHKNTLISLNGFDEEYKFIEDFPLWVKATINNYKLIRVPMVLVEYRIHSESIYFSFKNDKAIGINFFDSLYKYYKNVIFKLLLNEKLYFYYYHYKVKYLNLSYIFQEKKYLINPLFLKLFDIIYIVTILKSNLKLVYSKILK